jgi:hypothetical protein
VKAALTSSTVTAASRHCRAVELLRRRRASDNRIRVSATDALRTSGHRRAGLQGNRPGHRRGRWRDTSVDDIGRIINHDRRGQVHGGIAWGIGQALMNR